MDLIHQISDLSTQRLPGSCTGAMGVYRGTVINIREVLVNGYWFLPLSNHMEQCIHAFIMGYWVMVGVRSIAELIICSEPVCQDRNSVGKLLNFVPAPQNIFCVLSVQSERTLMKYCLFVY